MINTVRKESAKLQPTEIINEDAWVTLFPWFIKNLINIVI